MVGCDAFAFQRGGDFALKQVEFSGDVVSFKRESFHRGILKYLANRQCNAGSGMLALRSVMKSEVYVAKV